MNSLLSLVCCAEFLVALLLIPACSSDSTTSSPSQSTPNITTIIIPTSKRDELPTSQTNGAITPSSSKSNAATTRAITATSKSIPTTAATKTIKWYLDECFPVLAMAGGLIIGCVILLMSTLCLACKVCSLSRRLKALSSNSDMISNREYWMGNDNEDKNKSEARETTVLMTDITQTQEEMSNGAAKEEGEKAKEDGQTAGEKEEGDGAVNEEASAAPAAAESSSSPNPQEEAASSEPSNAAAAAASSEGKEEPKDEQ